MVVLIQEPRRDSYSIVGRKGMETEAVMVVAVEKQPTNHCSSR